MKRFWNVILKALLKSAQHQVLDDVVLIFILAKASFLFPPASRVFFLQLQLNLKSASVREKSIMVWRRVWCEGARARREEWGREGGDILALPNSITLSIPGQEKKKKKQAGQRNKINLSSYPHLYVLLSSSDFFIYFNYHVVFNLKEHYSKIFTG